MFSGKGLFKGIACPKADKCDLLNCIFSHSDKLDENRQNSSIVNVSNPTRTQNDGHPSEPAEGDRKRIKLENGAKASVSSPLAKNEDQKSINTVTTAPGSRNTLGSNVPVHLRGDKGLESMSRAISPPRNVKDIKVLSVVKDSPKAKPRPAETLNPRLVQTHPAAHSMRLELLRTLHLEFSRLNKLIVECIRA